MKTQMTNSEKADIVREAQEKLNEAIELLEQVTTPYYEAYILDHLKIMAGRDHGFMSRDSNLDDWAESFEQAGEVEELED